MDADVVAAAAVGGADEQLMTMEPAVQAVDETPAGGVGAATGDVLAEDQRPPADDGIEAVDASATRNQRELMQWDLKSFVLMIFF